MQIRSQDQHFPFSYRLNLDQTRLGMPCILDVAGRRIGNTMGRLQSHPIGEWHIYPLVN